MNFGIVSAIAQKDVRDAIRHRYLLTALVTPLFVAVLFRLLLPGMNSQSILTIVVHDASRSAIVSQLRKIPQITVIDITSGEAIVSEVQKHKAIGGLEVPVNFDADLAAGKQPELTVYLNNKRSTFEQGAFRRVLDQRVRSVARQPEPAVLVWVDIDKEVTEQTSGGITLDQMLLPLLLILALGMIGAFVVPLLIVEEKEKRTIDFLLSSPASLTEIIAGKALTGAVYTLLIAGLLLIINRHLIKSWSLMLLTVVLGLLFVVAVGLLTGSLLKNTMQVNTWASLVLIFLLAPSFPSIGMAGYVDKAMRIVPTYYLNEALKLSMSGTWSSQVWMYFTVLIGSTLITLLAAVWALQRRG